LNPAYVETHLSLASEAARLAGDLLAGSFGGALLKQATTRDVKLVEDERAQAVIVGHLNRHSGLPVLTEETGWIGTAPGSDTPYWVVDPLDGSFNYLYGIPLCCVSIALCRGMRPLAGCVHDFLRHETLTGAPDLGLRINGQVLPATQAASGILATGVPAGAARQGLDLDAALQRWRKLRLLGSAALSLAWVARGRMDAYHEDGIRWWDVAAGLALVNAAGGEVDIRAASGAPAGETARAEGRLRVWAWGAGASPDSAHSMEDTKR
jgi:myo-inositol-1(or 4)-monophosphatase